MSYGFRRPEELRSKDGIWGKRFRILAKEFSLIAIGNVLSKQMYLLSRRGLRIVPFSDTGFAAFMELPLYQDAVRYSWSGSRYLLYTFFYENPN